jgi:hypothetical protein
MGGRNTAAASVVSEIAALAMLALATPSFAAPCNGVYGCVVRARFCSLEQPDRCHYERLLPEQGVGLCTMMAMQTAVGWIVGDANAGKPSHPGFRLATAQCVTPDESDL